MLPPQDHPKRLTVWFKLTDKQVEIWNDAQSVNFPRCDAGRGARVALSRLQGVDNASRSLTFRVMTPEAMATEISYHVLNRRIERLEKLGLQLQDVPETPAARGAIAS